MTLYILQYNNYYNRILKKEETLEAYQEYVYYMLDKVNFVPNDGVNAMHTIGVGDYDGKGDYLLVCSEQGIDSRWFIIDAVRKRGGQYDLTLRRDLLADFKDEIMSADCFVEKGNVGFENPLVFNKENMSLNQIKTSEALLKDSTGCPWIVGYIPRNLTEKSNGDGYTPLITPDYKLDMNATDWEYYQYLSQDFRYYPDSGYVQFVFTNGSLRSSQRFVNIDITGEQYSTSYNYFGVFLNGAAWQDAAIPNPQNTYDFFKFKVPSYVNGAFVTGGKWQSKESTLEFQKYQDKIVQFNDGIYRVSFNISTYRNTDAVYNNSPYSVIYNEIQQLPNAGYRFLAFYDNAVNVDVSGTKVRLSLEKLSNVEETAIKWTIPSSSARAHLQDAPYDMFCIPYGDIIINNGATSFTTNAETGLSIANNIISNLVTAAAGELYDIQLLPYCPLKEDVRTDNIISLDSFANNTYYSLVTQGTDNTPINAIFFADSSSFSATIPYAVAINNAKMESNTDMYRLSSPNYNGQFEFNAAMNNGINYFTAECTYLPFTPYIHVKPDFKGLYGAENFNDARGLICGGDFSLPVVNDAWNSYKLQNKNYQEIFDRQIQNMQKTQDIARIQEVWGIATGTVSGATSGAMAGSMVGGGTGAAVGAVAGGVTSLFGGLADRALNEQLRTEALDYTRDQFQFQLGNVQALPNSLTKVSSFNINNRIFPVLEYYTCTDVEKTLLAKKIAINGMTVNALGNLNDYLSEWEYNGIVSRQYLKGRIVKLTDIGEDFHIINSISDEVFKGFYNKE